MPGPCEFHISREGSDWSATHPSHKLIPQRIGINICDKNMAVLREGNLGEYSSSNTVENLAIRKTNGANQRMLYTLSKSFKLIGRQSSSIII